MPYDGNCMSIAAAAACSHGDAHALRRTVATLVGAQPPGCAATAGRVQIAMINHMPVDVSSPAAWAAHVGKDGVWGTVAELHFLAAALDCPVHVYEAVSSSASPSQPLLRLRASAGLETSVRPPMRLLNVGNYHFRPLVPVVRSAGETLLLSPLCAVGELCFETVRHTCCPSCAYVGRFRLSAALRPCRTDNWCNVVADHDYAGGQLTMFKQERTAPRAPPAPLPRRPQQRLASQFGRSAAPIVAPGASPAHGANPCTPPPGFRQHSSRIPGALAVVHLAS